MVGPAGAVSAVSESEAKYLVGPSFVLPDLAGCRPGLVVQADGDEHLDATYYDTSGLTLLDQGVTVRFRRGEKSACWTVKHPSPTPTDPPGGTPGGVLRREEMNLAVAEAGDLLGQVPSPVPAPVAAQVASETGGDPLVPVAQLRTARRSWRLLVADRRLATVTDDEVEVFDAGRVAGRFREVEVELAPTVAAREGDEVVRAVGAALVVAGARVEPPIPKLERALRLLGRTGRQADA